MSFDNNWKKTEKQNGALPKQKPTWFYNHGALVIFLGAMIVVGIPLLYIGSQHYEAIMKLKDLGCDELGEKIKKFQQENPKIPPMHSPSYSFGLEKYAREC